MNGWLASAAWCGQASWTVLERHRPLKVNPALDWKPGPAESRKRPRRIVRATPLDLERPLAINAEQGAVVPQTRGVHIAMGTW